MTADAIERIAADILQQVGTNPRGECPVAAGMIWSYVNDEVGPRYDDVARRRAIRAVLAGIVEHNGKLYVVLYNTNGTLAVYRVRTDDFVKWLARWAAQLDLRRDAA